VLLCSLIGFWHLCHKLKCIIKQRQSIGLSTVLWCCVFGFETRYCIRSFVVCSLKTSSGTMCSALTFWGNFFLDRSSGTPNFKVHFLASRLVPTAPTSHHVHATKSGNKHREHASTQVTLITTWFTCSC